MDRPDRIGLEQDDAGRAKARRDADAAPLTRLPDVDPAPIGTLTPAALLHLQRAAGNAGVARLLAEEQVEPPRPIRGGGEPLEPATRAAMERSFGTDFGSVRVHRGAEAARSAAAFRARAYTVGEDVVLGDTAPEPRTIAHELTHVVQQRAGPVDGTPIGKGVRVSDPSDRFERAAEATADRVMGREVAPAMTGGGPPLQRQAEPEEEEEAAVETLPLQRQAEPEEEEEAAVETLPLQRQAEAEEEEEAAVETLPLQRQAEAEEEEEAAVETLPLQRQAEAEEEEEAAVETLPLQRQAEAEEEEEAAVETLPLQRQAEAEEEEEAAVETLPLQRQAEAEEEEEAAVETLPLQRQAEAEEEEEAAVETLPLQRQAEAEAPLPARRRRRREDLVFIMGQDPRTRRGAPVPRHRFFAAAQQYYRSQYPAARIVHLPAENRTLTGVFAWLYAQPALHVGSLFLVTHAATEGLAIPFEQGDKTPGTSFAELRDAVANRRGLFRLAGQVDAGTTIHVRGCNIGRNRAFVELLYQAFGGSSRLDAPTHRMHFELGREGGAPRAYFVDYFVERPGNWRASPDDLMAAFTTKYPQLAPEWTHLRQRVRRRPVTERIPGHAEVPVDDAARVEAIRRAQELLGDPDRYSWSTAIGRARGRKVPLSAVATRTEYYVSGQITGVTTGPTFTAEVPIRGPVAATGARRR